MAESGFWKGATFGVVAGAVLMRLLGGRPGAVQAAPVAPRSWGGRERMPERRGIRLRRDEGAGDPNILTSARTGANATFERAGGAPGGTQRPEASEVPGRPGQAIDYTNAAAPVRLSSRTLHLRREQGWSDESSPD